MFDEDLTVQDIEDAYLLRCFEDTEEISFKHMTIQSWSTFEPKYLLPKEQTVTCTPLIAALIRSKWDLALKFIDCGASVTAKGKVSVCVP